MEGRKLGTTVPPGTSSGEHGPLPGAHSIRSIDPGSSSLGQLGVSQGGTGKVLGPALLRGRAGTRVRRTGQADGYSAHPGRGLGFHRLTIRPH